MVHYVLQLKSCIFSMSDDRLEMISIKDIALGHQGKILFTSAGVVNLYKKQKVGLVGRNGCGKTSMFKSMLGQLEAMKGEIEVNYQVNLGYIEQEIHDQTIALLDYLLLAHPIYANEQVDLPEYWSLQPQAEKLLMNLGFKETDFYRPLSEFSGGWQMRANLAKALFVPSDIILFDEPTNHLDIETIKWFEDWLRSYSGLAVIISHDREFMDSVCTHIVAIYNKTLNFYTGNYSTYEKNRAEKEALEQKMQDKTQLRIAHLQKFVDRFKAKASKATQAQSRMKMIEKLQVTAAVSKDRDYNLEFLPTETGNCRLINLHNAKIGYRSAEAIVDPQDQEIVIIDKAKIQIFTEDRIGLLGANGQGKTTLIKTLINEETLLHGSLEKNAKIRIGYFAQNSVDQLQHDDCPVHFLKRQHPQLTEQQIYGYLGRFGFDKDASYKNFDKFSGGEKSRIILTDIILGKPNILILDEPTNHLDLQMREEICMSLQDFDGAVIIVSHDKFLLQGVVDKFYIVNNKSLTEFDGSLDDYYEML